MSEKDKKKYKDMLAYHPRISGNFTFNKERWEVILDCLDPAPFSFSWTISTAPSAQSKYSHNKDMFNLIAISQGTTPAAPVKPAKRAVGDSADSSKRPKRPRASREPAMSRAPFTSAPNEAIFQMINDQHAKDEEKWKESFAQAREVAELVRQRIFDENKASYDDGDDDEDDE